VANESDRRILPSSDFGSDRCGCIAFLEFCRAQLQFETMGCATFGGRQSKSLFEGAGESRGAFVTSVEGDLDHAAPGGLQLDCGGFQTDPLNVLSERLAHQCPEDPVKMAGREAGHAREAVQRERFAPVLVNEHQHPIQSLVIVVQGVSADGIHGFESMPQLPDGLLCRSCEVGGFAAVVGFTLVETALRFQAK
jgi:hypothetical protein